MRCRIIISLAVLACLSALAVRISDARPSERAKLRQLSRGVLPSGSVGSGEIADGAVASGDIANGTIVNADIATNAAIAESKLASDAWAQSDTNTTTTATAYTPRHAGDVLVGGAGVGTNAVWLAKGTTTNDWVQVEP